MNFTKTDISKIRKEHLVKAIFEALDDIYKADIIDTDMVHLTIGNDNECETKEDWKLNKLDEWLQR